jgi:hypothetical protein
MDNEKNLIQLCRAQIEQLLNWGDSQQWINQDFENLSDRIFDKTQVRLSVSTLKRIWGKVKYENSPTMATLNALAQFLDFENWREFQSKHSLKEVREETKPNLPPELKKRSESSKIIRISSIAAVSLAGLFLIFLLVKGTSKQNQNTGEAKFELRKISDDLPNSVVFNYDASVFHSDSVFIQQSWDPQRRERVDPNGKQHTSIYYSPGYFMAKLIVDNQIVKEDAVFIKTKGWKGLINDDRPIPVYLSSDEIEKKSVLGVSSEQFREKIGSSIFNNTWVTFVNVREFGGLTGSSFQLDLKVKNNATMEESLCRKIVITLLSKGGAIIIPLSTKGCISDIGLLTGERWLSGKENDLSAFGCDYADFEKITCKVADHVFEIYLNDKLAFKEEQKQPVGEIVGLRIAFEGPGEMKEVRLSNSEKVVYEDLF